jgi:hypothetical protein
MMTSGFAAITAARMAGASSPSAIAGSAPIRSMTGAFAAIRVVPTTE